jgi:hypothetical protein
VVVEKQAAVGQHAVHIEKQQFYGLGARDQRITGIGQQWVVVHLHHPRAQQVAHIECPLYTLFVVHHQQTIDVVFFH